MQYQYLPNGNICRPTGLESPKHLLAVPWSSDELTIKATVSGITILKDGRYRKRYTGSKQAAVNINGKLYLKASELTRELSEEMEKKGWKKAKPANYSTRVLQLSASNVHKDSEESETKKQINKKYSVNKTEVRQRINAMINTRRGAKELYFFTVTFPAGTTDNIAYQMFNIWLTLLRQNKKLKDYIWVAERQKIGTIHFHLAVPHKMPVVIANRYMAGTLRTFSKRGLLNYSVYQCKRYNGVDIAKHRKTRRVTNFAVKKGSHALATYLTKYVTKNDEKFTHLAWHNSRGYSALFTGITFTVQQFIGYGFRQLISKKSVARNDFFQFHPWLNDPPEAITNHLFDLNSYIQDRGMKN